MKRTTRTRRKELPESIAFQPLAFTAAGCGNPLPFTKQDQGQTEWCWAANAVSVNLFYNPASAWTQCALVNSKMNQTTCCENGKSSECNKQWYLDDALSSLGNLKAWTPDKATFADIQAEINGCRPFCLRIEWNRGGGHFVTVDGFDGENIHIRDPWYGDFMQPYATFPSKYQKGGKWTDNFFTKA